MELDKQEGEALGRRIVCFGDSNTYGYDACSAFGGRLPGTQRWPDILQDLSGWEILNRGMNGRTIPQRTWDLEDFDRRIAECEPFDSFFIMLGTNDLLNLSRPDIRKVADRMELFIRHAISHPVLEGKRGRILLAAPPRTEIGRFGQEAGAYDRESEKFGICYREIAERYGVCFVDAAAWKVPLAHDGVHIAPEGHQVFAEQLWKFMITNCF